MELRKSKKKQNFFCYAALNEFRRRRREYPDRQSLDYAPMWWWMVASLGFISKLHKAGCRSFFRQLLNKMRKVFYAN